MTKTSTLVMIGGLLFGAARMVHADDLVQNIRTERKDIREEKADIKEDKKDVKGEDKVITAEKLQLQRDLKTFGAGSPQVIADEKQLEDLRKARNNEVKDIRSDRKDVRSDVADLKKDDREARKDIRAGVKDIKKDDKDIHEDRKDVRKDDEKIVKDDVRLKKIDENIKGEEAKLAGDVEKYGKGSPEVLKDQEILAKEREHRDAAKIAKLEFEKNRTADRENIAQAVKDRNEDEREARRLRAASHHEGH